MLFLFDMLLIRADGRVNVRDEHQRTPLHWACEAPYAPAPGLRACFGGRHSMWRLPSRITRRHCV